MQLSIAELTGRERNGVLLESFRQRKSLFVDRLRWDLPVKGDQEVDEFDRLDSRYVMVIDAEDERLLGSARLLNTAGPHLLSEHFSYLCENGVPRGPDIWELSRLCIDPKVRNRQLREHVVDLLGLGLTESALLQGGRKLTFVIGTFLLPRVLDVGWDIRPLGLPQPCGRESIAAFDVDLRPDSLLLLERRAERSGAEIPTSAESTTRLGAA